MHIGRGTAGDVVAVVPDAGVAFSGDLVEYKSACYCGDAHFTDWLATLDHLAELQANALVPAAVQTCDAEMVKRYRTHQRFHCDFYSSAGGAAGRSLKDAFDFGASDDGSKVQDLRSMTPLAFSVSRAEGSRHRMAGDLDCRA
jgi:glyoxylase-like metal-dependent hydrolase (beta-lactamase superfamily II)